MCEYISSILDADLPVLLLQTSLLMALLGELPTDSGKMEFDLNGRIAYASEQSWIFSDTVRENILFGSDMHEEWYGDVIHACALDKVRR